MMTRLVVVFVGVSVIGALLALAANGSRAYDVKVMVGNRASKEQVTQALVVARASPLASSRPVRSVCPARFAPLPGGWVQGNLGPALLDRAGASTNNWAHNPRSFANLNDIPRDGIYVWAILASRQPTSPATSRGAPLQLPLSIAKPAEIAEQEGARPLPEYRFAGRHNGYDVDLRVDFGRHRPTRGMLQQAQVLLTRLWLPRWFGARPTRC